MTQRSAVFQFGHVKVTGETWRGIRPATQGRGAGRGGGTPSLPPTAALQAFAAVSAAGHGSGGAGGPVGLPILDTFTRANENPLSNGGKWTSEHFNTAFGCQLVSNAATGTTTAALSASWWNAANFGPNVAVYYTVQTIPAAGNYVRLSLRVSSVDSGSESGYMMQWSNDVNGLRIFREDVSAGTQLSQAAAARFANGDTLKFTAVGSTLTVYQNGASVLTATDATYAAAGVVMIGVRDQTTALINFGAQTL